MSNEKTESDSTKHEIMEATLRALRRHGYADLTMSDIADEFDKSQSLLHYHFETKHDLFVAFLDYLHDEIVSRTEEARAEADDPEEELMAIIELFFSTPDDFEGIQKALLELKAQASYDDDYREKMTEFDREMERVVSETVERGIHDGVFRDVDSDEVASFVLASVSGARTRSATVGKDDLEAVKREVLGYVDSVLAKEE